MKMLDLSVRIYKAAIFSASVFVPLLGMAYLSIFINPQLTYHGVNGHNIFIAVGALVSSYLSFVGYQNYKTSGDPFLRNLTLAFLGFSMIYACNGILVLFSDRELMPFLLFGPVARLTMAVYFLFGLLLAKGNPDLPETRSSHRQWWPHITMFVIIDAMLFSFSLSAHVQTAMLHTVEQISLGLYCACIAASLLRGIWGPLMWSQLLALAFFAEASVAFILGRPWNHMWWFAHVIFAAGFLTLGYALMRAQETTRSLSTAPGEAELFENLKLRTDELEQKNVELKNAADELALMHDRALEVSRFKSEFLSNMSHEIRTPLSAVIGMTELLRQTELNGEQRDFVQVAKDAGEAVLTIINDILDLSKIEAGKLSIDPKEYNIRSLVEGSAEIVAGKAREKGLQLMTFIAPEIPEYIVLDGIRVRQVLLNLMINAIKFTRQGEVIVKVEMQPADDHVVLKFSVKDTGVGLSPEMVARLFERFVQADGAISGGTGLGLSISKGLVQLMGGQITVESRQGEGTEFAFFVPGLKSDRIAAREKTSLENVRILVVDDNRSALGIISAYLTSWRMIFDTATDADSAMKLLKAKAAQGNPYQLALIDLVLQSDNGIELGEMIRKHAELASTRLILFTGFDEPGRGESALRAGFSAYLKKPLRQSQLFDAIASVLVEKAPSSAAEARKRDSSTQMVLIAEDNVMIQQVVMHQLDRLGVTGKAVGSGSDAVTEASTGRYSMIFMDCQMPDMDGLEATHEIRKRESFTGGRIPIVGLTAQAQQSDREQCLAAGMDDYLTKPATLEQLSEMLERWLPAEAKKARKNTTPVSIPKVNTKKSEGTDEPSNRASKPEVESTKATTQSRGDCRPPENTDANAASGTVDEEVELLDFEKLKRQCGQEAALDILAGAVNEVNQCMKNLNAGMSSENPIAVQKAAHHLRGLCATLGAMPMAGICKQIEEDARNKDLSKTPERMASLQDMRLRVEQIIDNLIARRDI